MESQIIVMVDDDVEDQYLAAEALKASDRPTNLVAMSSGGELLDYLRHQGDYASEARAPRPVLILLDLNMPVMDGHETLVELRKDKTLRDLPIVIFSTSQAESDIKRAYENGANTYIRKPQSFDELCDTLANVQRYWFEIAENPRGTH